MTQSRAVESSRTISSAQDRNSKLEKILKAVLGIRGVTAAVLVDGDGLVTHAQRNFDLSADALGAAVQVAFSSSLRASEHVEHGPANLVTVENKEGMVMLAPVHKGFLLAVVADTSALLGSVRYEIKQTVPILNEVFA